MASKKVGGFFRKNRDENPFFRGYFPPPQSAAKKQLNNQQVHPVRFLDDLGVSKNNTVVPPNHPF